MGETGRDDRQACGVRDESEEGQQSWEQSDIDGDDSLQQTWGWGRSNTCRRNTSRRAGPQLVHSSTHTAELHPHGAPSAGVRSVCADMLIICRFWGVDMCQIKWLMWFTGRNKLYLLLKEELFHSMCSEDTTRCSHVPRCFERNRNTFCFLSNLFSKGKSVNRKLWLSQSKEGAAVRTFTSTFQFICSVFSVQNQFILYKMFLISYKEVHQLTQLLFSWLALVDFIHLCLFKSISLFFGQCCVPSVSLVRPVPFMELTGFSVWCQSQADCKVTFYLQSV